MEKQKVSEKVSIIVGIPGMYSPGNFLIFSLAADSDILSCYGPYGQELYTKDNNNLWPELGPSLAWHTAVTNWDYALKKLREVRLS